MNEQEKTAEIQVKEWKKNTETSTKYKSMVSAVI